MHKNKGEMNPMKPIQEILNVINHSTGTDGYHKFSPIPGFPVITDGVLALLETAGCYWLIDVIGSHQSNKELDKAFQVWNLNVNTKNNSAVGGITIRFAGLEKVLPILFWTWQTETS